jgi:hypothetical protein
MRPLGLVGIIWSATAILCLALLLRYVLVTQEGFGINPRTIYIEQDKCPKGSFCPPGLETKQQFLCPPGRYGSEEGNTNPACNGLCDAGYTCGAGSTDKRQKKCPEGFYCLPGTSLLGELRPIPCPAGSFCPEGSEKPTPCAEGIYCPPQSGSGTATLKNTQVTTGNNGTVSCQTYCAGTAGKPWNDELPVNWNGSDCVATNDPKVGCTDVAGLRPNGIHCTCTPTGKGWVGATKQELVPPQPPAPPAPTPINLQGVNIVWKQKPSFGMYNYFRTLGVKQITTDSRYDFRWTFESGRIRSFGEGMYNQPVCLRYDKYNTSATPSIKEVSLSICGNEAPSNKKLQEWEYIESTGQIRSADSPDLCLSLVNQFFGSDEDYVVRAKFCESADATNPIYKQNFSRQQFILKS